MKYVIFKRAEMIIPVVSNEDAIHSLLKAGEDCSVVSAGFFYMNDDGRAVVETDRISTSLNIQPNKELDEKYLNYMLKGYSSFFFFDFHNDYDSD